jgi:DNA-binding MarR family transcriptional regulator
MADATGGTSIEHLVDEGHFAWMSVWKGQVLVARALEHAMREHAGFSLTWGEVLSRLGAAPEGRLRMQELARQVFVSKSGISQVVTQMSRHGLVSRQGDPENLRITYAVLTDEGRRVLQRSTTAFLTAIHDHFSRHVTPQEARVITAAMTRVIRAHGEEPDTSEATEAVDNLYRIVGIRPADESGATR